MRCAMILGMNETTTLLCKGALIGIANVIPGVSGGTVAVIMRIYDQLLGSISGFLADWKTHAWFLGRVLAGVAMGILVFSWVITWALREHREPTLFLFIGLIAGSCPGLFKEAKAKGWHSWYLLPFLATLAMMAWIALVGRPEGNTVLPSQDAGTLLLLFLSGAVGAAAMVVPGISGSFVLLLMGTYATVIHSIKTFDLLNLAVIGAGVGLGLMAATLLIKRLLAIAFGPTYAAILGLVFGSLFILWPGFTLGLTGAASAACLALGCGLAYASGRIVKPT